ncbi:MAG TPA: ParM/StbA family protein [Symbiobacteriaceae bacterium]|nr:ParM/StbA family protein [Symbiobacteriaceae bacterium]
MSQESLIAYVDRGFGFLKAGGTTGTEPLMTQSLISPGATLPGLCPEQLTMVYQGITYLVGTTVAKQSGIASFADLADAAPVSEESRLLYLASLAHVAGRSGTFRFRVVAGLPVDTWERRKDELKQMLLGVDQEHVRLRTDRREIDVTITVEDALVMPQPLGSALDFLLDEHGTLDHTIEFPFELSGQRHWAASLVATWRWCVLDIGFNTLNTYALDDMEPLRRFSISPKLGMAYAYQLIGRAAGGRSEIEVQEVLRQDRLLGHDAAFAELGRQITRLIRSWNSPHFAFYLITGGGAMALSQYILPDEENKLVAPAPQHANGRGYLKAGMQRWGAAVTV